MWETPMSILVMTQIFSLIISSLFLLHFIENSRLSISRLKSTLILSRLFLLNFIDHSRLLISRLNVNLRLHLFPSRLHIFQVLDHRPIITIQGHLVYTNDASQPSGGHNTISSIVTLSEKFAGACQVANPMILADPSWYINSGATDHVVADGTSLLNQVEYKGPNKLMVGSGAHMDITHIGNSLIPTNHSDIKLLHVFQAQHHLSHWSQLSQYTKFFFQP
ncbi:hypothetical protein FEM48_Zijuj08G0003500 [Ziziphus jujuba var. spinosa]|uniref:Uncharacterized protein n=1 Tax=Ziziphus jujuba var. spinosa TaxID=714518 RepID=A0A978UVW7_ZIZJJ|nr:hypothetical protein FEM48_Zijuj08G0003500 [Ziziphus jujuba var. spinosa]